MCISDLFIQRNRLGNAPTKTKQLLQNMEIHIIIKQYEQEPTKYRDSLLPSTLHLFIWNNLPPEARQSNTLNFSKMILFFKSDILSIFLDITIMEIKKLKYKKMYFTRIYKRPVVHLV